MPMIFGHPFMGATNQAPLEFGWMGPHLGAVELH